MLAPSGVRREEESKNDDKKDLKEASPVSPKKIRYNFAKGHPNNAELPVTELQHLFVLSSSLKTERTLDTESDETYPADLLRRALQYGQGSGNPCLLTELALFLDRQCANDDRGNGDNDHDTTSTDASAATKSTSLFITEGVSHGVDLLTRIATRPGDVVWCEQPTYYLVAGIFRSHGLTIRTLPMKPNGGKIDMIALAERLRVASLQTTQTQSLTPPHDGLPRIIYVIPSHQNPTGRSMSLSDRRELVRLAIQYNILVVADEVYHLLDWNNDDIDNDPADNDDENSNNFVKGPGRPQRRRPARMVTLNPTPGSPSFVEWQASQQLLLQQQDTDHQSTLLSGCVSVSSFTKLFAPGVRCGWIEAPLFMDGTSSLSSPIIDALNAVGYIQSQGAVCPVMSSVLAVGLRDGTMESVLQRYRMAYQRRCNILCRILQSSNHSLTTPQGDDLSNNPITQQPTSTSTMQVSCHPTGGYFVWVRFPSTMGPVDEFLSFCIETASVSFMPGTRCDALRTSTDSSIPTFSEELDSYGRLCFAMLDDADIERGAELLVECFESYMKSRSQAL